MLSLTYLPNQEQAPTSAESALRQADKCMIAPRSGRVSEGMEVPQFRLGILQYYEAFRMMAKDFWEGLA